MPQTECFARASFPPIFQGRWGDFRLLTAGATGHGQFQDAETSNKYRCLGAKTLPSSPNRPRPIIFFKKRAAIERGGRNNSANCSEKINRLHSQFERVPAPTTFLYELSLCLEDFRFSQTCCREVRAPLRGGQRSPRPQPLAANLVA